MDSPIPAAGLEASDLYARPFEAVRQSHSVTAFGVDYVHLAPPEGGDLYVTRYGWPVARQLLPANWYVDKWYSQQGQKLAGATGNVYHVHSRPVDDRSADLIVKFSRVAQEVSIVVETSFPEEVSAEEIAAARFNSPMEEFGLVMELRRRAYDPTAVPILTQLPLAIYAPAQEYQLWQLGRRTSWFHTHRQLLAADQEDAVKAIELDIRRIYVLLYGWIKGRDAEQFFDAGDITEPEMFDLTGRVVRELAQNGFRVLDNKPKHFILRKRSRDGSILSGRRGYTYGLVDFEFLQRTSEYQRQYKTRQRARYQRLQADPHRASKDAASPGRNRTKVFGVDYLLDTVQDGGRLWVVGQSPELFDFFVPDRWRRTPRLKLSPSNEVYRTRTRDNIHVVYRRSRVGSRPRVDPLDESGRRQREHGYNSPFEEVVIAQTLRQLGVPTVFPRAIYRTGNPSTQTAYLRDLRRIDDHAHLLTPDETPEPMLAPDYDYYTIWGYFRGFGPALDHEGETGANVEEAAETGLLTDAERRSVADAMQATLDRLGLAEVQIAETDIQVYLDLEGRVWRNERGEVYATFGIDAMRACEIGLIDEEQYRRTIERVEARLRAADCEALDLQGDHILLSFDVRGRPTTDREGEPAFALCNFEFVRGLYRPIR